MNKREIMVKGRIISGLGLLFFISITMANSGSPSVSLYPWNVSLAGYYTLGNYSTGQKYESKAGYFSMDRRWKDRFTVSYEDISISTDSTDYRQYNLLARDFFWIKTAMRVGGIVGLFHTNSSHYVWSDSLRKVYIQNGITNYLNVGIVNGSVKDNLNGWLVGTQITGDLPWLGYAVSFVRSNYQFLSERDEIYYYQADTVNNIIFQADTIPYNYTLMRKIPVNQFTYTLSRRLGKHIFRFGQMFQSLEDKKLNTIMLTWDWQPVDRMEIVTAYLFGENRFFIDPNALLLNNNPDILTKLFSIRIALRLSTNWHIIGVYSRHNYDSLENHSPYHVKYFAVGLQARF